MEDHLALSERIVRELRAMATNFRFIAGQTPGTGIAEAYTLIAAGVDRMADRREQDEKLQNHG